MDKSALFTNNPTGGWPSNHEEGDGSAALQIVLTPTSGYRVKITTIVATAGALADDNVSVSVTRSSDSDDLIFYIGARGALSPVVPVSEIVGAVDEVLTIDMTAAGTGVSQSLLVWATEMI